MALTKQERSRKYYLANKEIIKAKVKKYRQLNKKSINARERNYHYINTYGLTEQEKKNKIEQQNGLCAICNKSGELVVDHDHKTGAIRGMIHRSCNSGIGLLGDTLESVELAVSYLRKHYGSN